MENTWLNLGWLLSNHKMIHYFGLGFIQVKLGQFDRLHFYTPKLPPIIDEEEIHNHRYDFKSLILKGTLTQHLYNIVEGTTHIRRFESCQAGVAADPTETLCGVEQSSMHTYNENSSYFLNHQTFHKVDVKRDCITYLYRTDYKKEFSEVVSLVDAPKVCPFSQKVDDAELWKIIEEMLK